MIVDIVFSANRHDRYDLENPVIPLNNSQFKSIAYHGTAKVHRIVKGNAVTSDVNVEVYMTHADILAAAKVIVEAANEADREAIRNAIREWRGI